MRQTVIAILIAFVFFWTGYLVHDYRNPEVPPDVRHLQDAIAASIVTTRSLLAKPQCHDDLWRSLVTTNYNRLVLASMRISDNPEFSNVNHFDPSIVEYTRLQISHLVHSGDEIQRTSCLEFIESSGIFNASELKEIGGI